MPSISAGSNAFPARAGLSRDDVKTLGLASLGGALEFYDFIVAAFFTTTLAAVFFPRDMPDWLAQLQVFCVFAAGYVVRPFGGVVLAHFGDRLGRKKMFTFGLFLMALPTLLIGLLPNYETAGIVAPLLFLTCRMLQGLSVGGEVPGAWIFCAEHVREKRVGLACGLLMGGLCLGILLGALTSRVATSALSPEELVAWGWRIPFLIGGVFGLISVHLRRYLRETPVFEALRARRETECRPPISIVLASHGRRVLVSMAAIWVFAGIFVIYFLYLPTYFQTQWNYPAANVFTANCWGVFLLTLGGVFAGWAADIIGGGKTFMIGSGLMFAVMAVLGLALGDAEAHVLNLYALGGFSIGAITLGPYIIVRSFPPEVRFTGFALSYNSAYAIFGGTAPLAMAALVGGRELISAPFCYMMALCILGAAIGALWRPLDETQA
ncbi:MAG: MFS transporter [Methylocystis sp.]|jgi:MFS family permease